MPTEDIAPEITDFNFFPPNLVTYDAGSSPLSSLAHEVHSLLPIVDLFTCL